MRDPNERRSATIERYVDRDRRRISADLHRVLRALRNAPSSGWSTSTIAHHAGVRWVDGRLDYLRASGLAETASHGRWRISSWGRGALQACERAAVVDGR